MRWVADRNENVERPGDTYVSTEGAPPNGLLAWRVTRRPGFNCEFIRPSLEEFASTAQAARCFMVIE
jgi:hypothetical protein